MRTLRRVNSRQEHAMSALVLALLEGFDNPTRGQWPPDSICKVALGVRCQIDDAE